MLADETEAEMLGNNLDESDTDNLGEVLLREVNSFIDGNLIGVLAVVVVVVAVVVDDGDEIVDIMILSCNEMKATMNVNLIMNKKKKEGKSKIEN